MNIIKLIKSRFKQMYIMTAVIQDIPKKNKNELLFFNINYKNVSDFKNNGFIELDRVLKHGENIIGAYKDGVPVAFGAVKYRDGETKQTDYFLLKRSKLYLMYLCVLKDYRGKEIMGDLISYLANIYDVPPDENISLCVAVHNTSAIGCYKKSGFQINKKRCFIHFYWPYDFPKYSV